jgi:hypothetical protein
VFLLVSAKSTFFQEWFHDRDDEGVRAGDKKVLDIGFDLE